jgi:hypothetical protein
VRCDVRSHARGTLPHAAGETVPAMAEHCLLKKKRRIFAVSIWSKSGWMRPMLHSTACNTGNVLYNLVQYNL